jgi:hypothetical protein
MWAHLAVPRTDPFSFTANGVPWMDFEWMTQIFWGVINAIGGLRALWVLKVVLLCAAFLPVDGLLQEEGATHGARAGALGLWLAAVLAQADLRADLISAVFFAVLLRRLCRGRASFLFGFGLFALWANLHAGFPLGFFLYGLALFVARIEKRAPASGLHGEIMGALFGTWLNPYGVRLYGVLFAHASAPMARYVFEWGPPSPHNSFQLPLLVSFVVVSAAAWIARRRLPKFLFGAALVTGIAAAGSARFGIYFAAASSGLIFTAFPRPRMRSIYPFLAGLTGLLVIPVASVGVGPSFTDRYVARHACDFIARERGALGGLRLFNQYEWGGYLGWVLGPDGRVFGDGRYLFHDQLPETQDALTSPEAMAAYAARHDLDGFLIKNYPETLPSTRAYPDGTSKAFARPWHVSFFPRERWALVYWDGQALLFVDRHRVPADWLARHEYRWLIPNDDAARDDARARGEIPESALSAELSRHDAETTP